MTYPSKWLALLMFSLCLSGCYSPPDEPTNEEVNQAAQARVASEAAARQREAEQYAKDAQVAPEVAKMSGGLGLPLPALEQRYGKLVACGGFGDYLCIEGKPEVAFIGRYQNGDVYEILIEIPAKMYDLSEIRRFVAPYLPVDRQYLTTYSNAFPDDEVFTSPANDPIDLYQSDWLATRFAPDGWMQLNKGPKGNFSVKITEGSVFIDIGKYRD